ncbi:hypothetical protein OsI_37419 [Oryza sativa Indica Group]|uniref:Uncharacterized protein n=1 Tax=Oryza sativa subsp. indica TaxID=39946 RepID=A2ZHY2_ORYSI|nr:hypothetical protein OsI_37419 [Oryza sativa Indica Group]
MGSEKRKTRDRHGARGKASYDKPKPSITDPELEETEDADQFESGHLGIIGGDSDKDQADCDQPMQEATEDLNQPGIVGDELDEGRGRSVYLVACHWDWSRYSKPYSVYNVGVTATATATSSPPQAKRKRLRRITRLPTAAGGKSFTSVRSIHRAWIVGVGGDPGETVIFDTRTEKVVHGPALNSAKWCPALMAVGDKVYAMSKSPSWIADPDFPPWFELLDLSQSKVVAATAGRGYHLEGCSWIKLPHPPCFPWKLRPVDYTLLPVVIVMSYVVVDAYILVSFNQPWGTYAFDTNSIKWHKVDDKRLPFTGCAAPHGSVFLGLSKDNGPINAYRINVTTSDKEYDPCLSIVVLPVKYMEHEVDAGSCFFSLEDGLFCSLRFSLDSSSVIRSKNLEVFPTKAHVDLRTYQTENTSPLEAPEETLLAVKPEVRVCSQWEQAFKISCSSHGFSPFAFALLSI